MSVLRIFASLAEKFRAKGSDAVSTDPEYTRKFITGEVARWNKTIKVAGIPPQDRRWR